VEPVLNDLVFHLNRATGDVAASSQDAQRQMQGQPTAAQQAQGAKPSEKMADQGC
jgi:hypothetical protein